MITLETLPKATAQEVFDRVKTHLLTQNAKSMTGKRCMYRGGEGRKCAAGCLIADSEYDSANMENRRFSDKDVFPRCHTLLIVKLQAMHDSETVEDWPKELKRIASEEGLNYEN